MFLSLQTIFQQGSLKNFVAKISLAFKPLVVEKISKSLAGSSSCSFGITQCIKKLSHRISALFIYFSGKRDQKGYEALLPIIREYVEAKIGFSYFACFNEICSGDIAIDDVSFINCALPPIEANCALGQFACARGACVDVTRVCDFTDDCGDSSDENCEFVIVCLKLGAHYNRFVILVNFCR